MKLLPLTALLVTSCVALGCSSGPGENACSSESQALSVCATGATIKGVDVSTYQGTIDWASVKGAGIAFAIARMSDGLNYPDKYFAGNWKNMKAQGIVRGVYQFFEPAQDPTQQANMLLDAVQAAGGFEPGDLPPVMDIEVTGSQSTTTIRAHMQTWLDVIEKAVGRKPLIYTGASMSSTIGSGFAGYPLWVANWGVSCPLMPSGWTGWQLWQNSDNGSVSGISGNVDTDKFNGTLSDLQAWAADVPADAGAPAPGDAGAKDGAASAAADGGTSSVGRPPPPVRGATSPCGP